MTSTRETTAAALPRSKQGVTAGPGKAEAAAGDEILVAVQLRSEQVTY